MLPAISRTVLFIFVACLFLTPSAGVVPEAEAADRIVIIYGPSLDSEGTPFEEPEGDNDPPKIPQLRSSFGQLGEREVTETPEVSGRAIRRWLPLLSWYARLRF